MTLRTPLWMQAASGDTEIEYSGAQDRDLLYTIFNQQGVCNSETDGDLKVVQRAAGATMSVDVAPGYAIIFGGDVVDQGLYAVHSDAVENVAVPAPPALGSRTHLVVAQIRDKLYNAAYTTYDWVVEVLEDTGGGTPAAPASSLQLATVTVAAAQTSVTDADITDLRRNAVFMQAGLPRYATSASARPAVPWEAEQVWRTDLGDVELYDGSAWRQFGLNPPYAILNSSSGQDVSASVATVISFNSEIADSHGGHSTSTNNARYTAPRAGVYRVSAAIPFAPDASPGKYEIAFRVSGATSWTAGMMWKESGAITAIPAGQALVQMSEGDYVEAIIWHNTGSTRTTDTAHDGGPRFEIEWVRSL